MQIWARKSIASLQAEAGYDTDERRGLRRSLGVWNLSSLGIGCTIGAGIFVLTGTAAANYAGPAVALSFVLAAAACLCAALCYGELASMIPVAGSAYTYAYATMGELVAWVIGWNLVLEYLIAASTVAVGWSGYFTAFLAEQGANLPSLLTQPPLARAADGTWAASAALGNVPAAAIVIASTAVLATGIRESAFFNNLMVAVKLIVIVLVIAFGSLYVDPANWHPFVPPGTGVAGQFGWSGVTTAAGIVFFAYIGFDAVTTSAQEARDPRRTVPLALLITLVVCTVLYVAMSLVMTGLAPYASLNVPHPVFVAVDRAGSALAWLKPIVSLGAIFGLASAILTTLYGQSRVFFSMARDGLIPPAFADVHPVSRVPTRGTWYAGMGSAVVAALLPIDVLGELVSIGTLMAFAIVCAGLIVLRRTQPDAPRAFRAPCGPLVAILGVITCVWLMWSLPVDTWFRLAVWLTIGFAIYAAYGIRRSHLRRSRGAPPDVAESITTM